MHMTRKECEAARRILKKERAAKDAYARAAAAGENTYSIKARLRGLKPVANRARKKLAAFIETIDDEKTRAVFDMVYMRGYSYLAASMRCGARDDNYARKIIDKYFREQEKEAV